MKRYLFSLCVICTFSACKNSNSEGTSLLSKDPSIFDQTFSDYKEIPALQAYSKVSDTTFLTEPDMKEYRITEIKNDTSHIVMFNELSHNAENNEVNTILDTLSLENMQEGEFISIGYCDYQGMQMPQIITKFNMKNDSLSEIKRAWLANPSKMAFERIYELDSIGCEFQIIKNEFLKRHKKS